MARLFQVLFCNANLVNRCVDLGGLNQLKTYSVDVGSFRYMMFDRFGLPFAARKLYISSFKLSIGKEVRLEVPHNVQFLGFYECRFGCRSLLDNVPSLRCAFQLKEFVIVSCEGIESIISEGGDSKALAGIQKLKLERLDDLIGLIREEEVHPYISFASLRRLEMNKCGKVKKLWRLNTDLPNLEEVEVQSCEQMELVFATERGATIELPRLRSVVLIDLPKLRSRCLPIHSMSSLTTIEVSSCSLIEEIFLVEDETRDKAIQLPCLKKLRLDNLPELRTIFVQLVAFPQLATLEVSNCPKLKKLDLLSHQLPSLADLSVLGCQQMEEIFETEEDADVQTVAIQCPNLKRLRLLELPELKSICRKTLVCNSLESLQIDDFSSYKLENFPISLPRLSTNHHRIPKFEVRNVSRHWLLYLRWNDPDTKAFFHQLGSFASSYF